ncbi:c-type cytochrome [Halieaceae bacterium IMCC8485]|uniref:C-type cytochrome n=1 Tax=Candidatus Seongchinamella marina TaxID=2518990 RepID=A0ABT3SUD1_9GAMM|nr:di-heme oxidoredictase family protein [Candidatus Seongchinamella marina]MCX2973586.1 c-type cytochrome [Candidatus Seongchinamella marina]
MADPDDLDGDGISGRMRRVRDPESGQLRLGRFGWKASQASVRHQVASALNTDLGVMTSTFPAPDCGPMQMDCGASGAELPDEHLDTLTTYVSLLGVRARRGLTDPEALAGEALFADSGCLACHVNTFTTTPYHPHAELRNQTIHPYTDLMLHDMGPGLASTLNEADAGGGEWRTAPLWGIGLTAGVSGGEAYLHDGRARNLEEAILWHGGEAEESKQAFVALTAAQRSAVIMFLKTL